jgi:hypothetical protein
MAESVDEQLIVVSQVSLVASLIIFLLIHFVILVPDFSHLELITFVLKM